MIETDLTFALSEDSITLDRLVIPLGLSFQICHPVSRRTNKTALSLINNTSQQVEFKSRCWYGGKQFSRLSEFSIDMMERIDYEVYDI